MVTNSKVKNKKYLWGKRAQELFDKKMITPEQFVTLDEMIASPDQENFTLVESIIKTMIREKLSEGLNEGQTLQFENILKFIDSPQRTKDAFVLKGYAGTGKTFLVARIIEYIMQTDTKKRIAVGAPTNKAVQVLYLNSALNKSGKNKYVFEDIFNSEDRFVYSTVHKLLGLKETVTDDGKQIFTADSYNDSKISDYNYLLVDEVSMLDDKICTDILGFSNKIPIIFMGDPAQIPPIKRLDSIPFKSDSGYNFEVGELTEIMRQKGEHPIVDASFIIRDNLTVPQPIPVIVTKLNDKDHGIVHMDAETQIKEIRPLLTKYFKTPQFEQDANYMKVIGWRNKTIEYMNDIVREILFGEKPAKYKVGEKLIVQKPIFEKSFKKVGRQTYENWRMAWSTSEELEIVDIAVIFKDFTEGSTRQTLTAYSIDVISKQGEAINKDTIFVIHEDDLVNYNKILNEAKANAMKTRQSSAWIKYFNIMKWSANVTYNYAITAHKSQGSTYKNVLILENDIDNNKSTVERNRIKYTAYTRATDLLYVFRKNIII